ncbi:hypothetical protein MES5069_750127 [Mesorhizobium escarrei]|uniref:Uncharacterized protein n=1 Tax=Mesorhizobium escarrei TaxID=666018 RepID=A0ABM9EJQ3_9HYPH|nr:hypothetical protein MES5069_750127 [Mesorhizobium escarrei]
MAVVAVGDDADILAGFTVTLVTLIDASATAGAGYLCVRYIPWRLAETPIASSSWAEQGAKRRGADPGIYPVTSAEECSGPG